jgi:hypothetical protein
MNRIYRKFSHLVHLVNPVVKVFGQYKQEKRLAGIAAERDQPSQGYRSAGRLSLDLCALGGSTLKSPFRNELSQSTKRQL